ncbi:MAG: hypothetical protein AAGC57_05445 [Pseudomonadota bacterium]
MPRLGQKASMDPVSGPVRMAVILCAIGAIGCLGGAWLTGALDGSLTVAGLVLALWANLLSLVLLFRRRRD